MADFQSKLIRKEEVADGTMAFYVEKPEGFSYVAGQHPTVKIVHPAETDEEGDSRTFSFITIPSDPEVGFTTRMRDTAFKRNIKNAPEGLEIELKNPRGSMILPTETGRPLVFLAGGIGITPFMSMIRQATHEQSQQDIYMFYANRTIGQAAFLKDLEELAQKNPHFTFIPTMTQEDDSIWTGEKGRITKELIQKHLPRTEDTIYYLAGPTGMVTALMDTLTSLGIDPLFIKSEDYGEYK